MTLPVQEPSRANGQPQLRPTRHLFASGRQRPLLLATLALGFGLRVCDLASQSLSSDEVTELQNAGGGLTEIVRRADGFPPLYNLLLHGWLDLFPDGLAARWLSVLVGLLSILFGWLLGRRIGGDAVGLWTALFLAVSPLLIWYSQEGRTYALYILLATVALWALLRALESDSLWDWSLYAATAAAGMYVHYFFVVVLSVGALTVLYRRGRDQLAKPITAYLALAVLCLPLLWLIRSDLSLQAGSGYTYQRFGIGALVYTYVSIITGYTLGPSLGELHTMKTAEAFAGFLPWLALMALPLAILGFHGRRVLPRGPFDWLVLLIAAPVAATGAMGLLAGVGYNVRYVVWVAVPVTVLLAAGATQWRRWPVAASVTAILGLFGAALVNRHFSDRYRNEDVRAASAYLKTQPDRGIPIFVLSGYVATTARYYLGQERAVYSLRRSPGEVLTVPQALEMISSKTPSGQPYWFVYSRPFHDDPHGTVRQALDQRDHIRMIARFPGVVLYRGVTPAKVSQDAPHVPSRPQRSAS